MKCPECVRTGQRSSLTVSDGYVSTVMGGSQTYYDADGYRHHHEVNESRGQWRCSNGHVLDVVLSTRCGAPACDYGHELTLTLAGGQSMSSVTDDLEALEHRVVAKFLAAERDRYPDSTMAFDPTQWDTLVDPAKWGQPRPGRSQYPSLQFPREKWVTYPTRRMMALLIVDRALDIDLAEEDWHRVSWLLAFGGRQQIA